MSSKTSTEKSDSDRSWSNRASESSAYKSTSQTVRGFMSSPGAKFILLGVIMFALLIPTFIVWGLVEERSRRADTVAQEISQGWGNTQTINGPYLVIPYLKYDKVKFTASSIDAEPVKEFVTRHAIYSAEQLNIDGKIDVQERNKSIYKTQLYHMKTGLTGKFSNIDLEKIKDHGGVPKPEDAFLVIGVSDTTGFRSDLNFKMNGKSAGQFLPGLNSLGNGIGSSNRRFKANQGSGVYVPVTMDNSTSDFSFEIDMALNGSRKLAFVPSGKTTKLDLASNWPHPGFDGKFLPEARKIDDKGFSATWTIPNLARGIDAMQLSSTLPQAGTAIGVNFVEPLSFYQVTSRSLKYAIGVFSLVFLAVFVLEFSGKSSLHWIQYILTGLAMIVFYILLLALAEQVGFLIAYLTAAIATTVLIAWYIGDALGSKNGTWIVGGVLSTTYLVLYLTLNEETYALLAGSLIAFIAIAATMFATRKIDWSGQSRSAEAQ